MSKVDWGDESDDEDHVANVPHEVEEDEDDEFVIGSTLNKQRSERNNQPNMSSHSTGDARSDGGVSGKGKGGQYDRGDRRDRGGKGYRDDNYRGGKGGGEFHGGGKGGDFHGGGKGRDFHGGGKGRDFHGGGKGRDFHGGGKGGDFYGGGKGSERDGDGSPRGANFMGGKYAGTIQNAAPVASGVNNVAPSGEPPKERKKLQLLKRTVEEPVAAAVTEVTSEASPRAASIFGAGSPRDVTVHEKPAANPKKKTGDRQAANHKDKEGGDVAQVTDKLGSTDISQPDKVEDSTQSAATPGAENDGASKTVLKKEVVVNKNDKTDQKKSGGKGGGKGGVDKKDRNERNKGKGGDKKGDEKKNNNKKGDGKGGKGGAKDKQAAKPPQPPAPVEEKKKAPKPKEVPPPAKKKPANIFASLMDDDSDSD